jgi:hypothetical protein
MTISASTSCFWDTLWCCQKTLFKVFFEGKPPKNPAHFNEKKRKRKEIEKTKRISLLLFD